MHPLNRRHFLALSAATAAARLGHAAPARVAPARGAAFHLVAAQDRVRILRLAAQYASAKPETLTSFPAPNSPGTPHDFFSESDYFWPNPAIPSGPYKEIDGKSNPDNFQGHRRAMIRLSQAMPGLTAAFILTGNKAFAQTAAAHLRAWFITPDTRMNPSLQYAQGVRNGVTGRSYGIIDTLHLVEVARAATFLRASFTPVEYAALQQWFRDYLLWLNASPNGIKERDSTNNHAIAWALQAAEFAHLAQGPEAETIRKQVRDRFINTQLPTQMAPDGSFPRETARTKPYGYSIFTFDCAAALCLSLSSSRNPGAPCLASETWAGNAACGEMLRFTLPDGRGLCRAAEFLAPFLADKTTWPFPHDVQHWEAWPVRSPGLLFCGLACSKPEYITLWKRLDPDPTDPEVIRNFPIRQPLLWVA